MMKVKTFRSLTMVLILAGSLAVADEGDRGNASSGEASRPRSSLELSRRPFLGVELVEINQELATHFGTGDRPGVLVGGVVADSPAARAGIQVGDVITAIDGANVDGAFQIGRQMRDKKEGESVAVELYRNGAPLTLRAAVELRERPVLDLSGLGLLRGGDGELVRRHLRTIDPQAIDDAVHRATAILQSPEWKAKLDSMRKIETDVAERMKELEKRLGELERQLEAKSKAR